MQRTATQLTGLGVLLLLSSIIGVAPRARASCIAPQSCVCETLPNEHVLRGRVASFDGARAAVEVVEVLASRTPLAAKPGMTIAGIVDDASFCEIPEASFAPGDEVLALWQGPTHDQLLDSCEVYASCSHERCDASGASAEGCHAECFEASMTACPEALDRDRLVLIAWQDQLDLGESRQLPATEAALLGNRDRCLERFPAPPLQPCDDVAFVPVDEGCNIARHNQPASATWWLLLLLWAARRRVPR
jgi:hypothetical protein